MDVDAVGLDQKPGAGEIVKQLSQHVDFTQTLVGDHQEPLTGVTGAERGEETKQPRFKLKNRDLKLTWGLQLQAVLLPVRGALLLDSGDRKGGRDEEGAETNRYKQH